jgi:GNAT superfamily N-acetyltransferase
VTASIGLIEKRDIRDTGRVLARSFAESPLMVHCVPDDRRRPAILRSFFRAIVRDARPFDGVFVARDADRVRGAAVWLPPGRYPPSTARQLRQMTRAFALGPMGPRALQPSLRYLRAAERVHPKAMHWYLAVLGVDPDYQGRGLGRRLLEPILERADTEAQPAYLETDREQNLAFYARFRFGLVDTLHPDGPDAPAQWTMWRAPEDP